MGIDDVIRRMEEDELRDKAATTTKLPVNEYARLRRITPQRVYYYIRNKRLKRETCNCGRPVIDINDADEVMGFKEKKDGETLRSLAEEAEEVYCPHGCGALTWREDRWFCPVCRDEFEDDSDD